MNDRRAILFKQGRLLILSAAAFVPALSIALLSRRHPRSRSRLVGRFSALGPEMKKTMRRKSMNFRRAIALFATSIIVLAAPGHAYADDLGVLYWLIFVWPAGIVFGLALIILGIITARRIKRGQNGRGRFGLVAVITAVVLDLAFTALSLSAAGATRTSNMPFAVMHIAAFQIVSLPCLLLGIKSWRRGRGAAHPAEMP